MEKCEMCPAESKYEYREKNLCSDCVTVLALRVEKSYHASDHDGVSHKVIINGDVISILSQNA